MEPESDILTSDFSSPARPEVCDEHSSTEVLRASVTGRERSRGGKDPLKYGFRPKLTHKQTLAWDALARIDVKEVLYGGAKGGGKSVFGCLWCFEKALDIIKLCEIGPRKHPIPVGFMGRKRGVDFTNTTLETWKRFIPEDMYEIKGKPAEIIVCGRVHFQ